MNLKSFFKKLFLGGEVIEKVYSPINGEVLVLEDLKGKIFVRVGGITQSGGIVEKIWEKIIKTISNQQLTISNCLILGLGCGSVANLLAEKWLGIKITGIEIDPKMIEIGRKYFNLGKIPNLKVVVGGGIKAVSSQPSAIRQNEFNLILVDMYCGQEFPKEAENEEFLNGLRRILGENGLIIFNRLNFGIHKKETLEFLKKQKIFFPRIFIKNIKLNQFIFCQNFASKKV